MTRNPVENLTFDAFESWPLVKIPMADFLRQVYPPIDNHTILTKKITEIFRGLSPAQFYMRGGAMRQKALYWIDVQNDLDHTMAGFPKSYIGESPFISEVLRHAFPSMSGEGHDLDIPFVRRSPNGDFIPDSEIRQKIDKANTDSTHPMPLEIRTIALGTFEDPMTIFKILLTNTVRMDLADLPLTDQQRKSSGRIYDGSSWIDLATLGKVIDTKDGLAVAYPVVEGLSIADLILSKYYLFFPFQPIGFDAYDPYQVLSGKFRDVSFRAFDHSSLSTNQFLSGVRFDSLGDHTSLHAGLDNQLDQKIKSWISRGKSGIEKRHKELVTEAMYGLIANPFLALPMTYLNYSLFSLPLGQIIKDWDTLRAVENQMIEIMRNHIGADHSSLNISSDLFLIANYYAAHARSGVLPHILGPLLLVEAIKSLGLLPDSVPTTLSTAGVLSDSSLLLNDQWEEDLTSGRP